MNKPVTSFKKFLKKQAPLTLITIPHKKTGIAAKDTRSPETKTRDDIRLGKIKEEVEAADEQLDEFYKPTPANSGKTGDLHDRLKDYYNIDGKDKEGLEIFKQFHGHINNALHKASAPKVEKSKPDPADPEADKYGADAQAAGKKIDALLSAHKAPTADFHVYAGLKGHPFESAKKTQGYEPEGEEPVEAHLPGFVQSSIDPNFAKQNAGKGGHVLKMQIKAGSNHGAYIGHHNDGGHDKEFLMRPGRKLRVHPKAEEGKDGTTVWHGELTGNK